jgi:hypothetical protein
MAEELKSGTYSQLLYHAMPDTIHALKIAQRLAKEVGTDLEIAQINYALKMIDYYELRYTPREAAYLARFADDCAKNGAD